jgi:two-component system sensor histidine kinase KdpD
MEQTLTESTVSSSAAPKPKRGRIKLFLGYAAGAGKTYSMLSEACRRKHNNGEDVIIGYIETHQRADTEKQIDDLEIIPRKSVEYRGVWFDEMDVEKIIRRKPQCVVIDELAHLNVPGSHHSKRCLDVLQIAESGINVLTAMNVQHIESLNDSVQHITGVKIRETVPDTFFEAVDEIVNIDVTPEALLARMARGKIYVSGKIPIAMASFFTEGNLSAMRELALREIAGKVEKSVQSYKAQMGIDSVWQTKERVMVCLSRNHPSDQLLRRSSRVASRLNASVAAVVVLTGEETEKEKKSLDIDRKLAQDLGILVEEIRNKDVAKALAGYAWKHEITEIIIGHSHKSKAYYMLHASMIDELIRQVPGIDVLVVANP